MKKRLLFLFVLLFIVLLASLPGAPAAAAPAQQTNLLNNPGFEQPYSNGAANGWGRWHQETGGDISCEEPWAGRPEWSPETNTADLIHGGSVSQHVGVQYNKWHAGVMQNVSVTPGTTYRFTFWARGRAAEENYPAPSLGFINMNVQARIDPQGRGNWGAPGLAFGATGSPHDVWQQFSVEATATGDQITVFVAANFRDSSCARHMDVWFDDAQLVEVGPPPTNTPPPQPTAPPPPPAPAATNTPIPPTETPTPEVTPTDTPVPTETPTLTPTTPPGGIICVNAFADENANGQHEDNEGAMAGVTFTIASGGDVVAQGISSGPDPLCFEELEPGNYQVAQTVPNTLEMTTGGNTGVTVNEGQTIFVEFGSRARPGEVASGDTISPDTVSTETDETADPAGGEAPAEDGFGSTLLAVSGLGAIFLAIVMLGVIIFLLLRQRT